MAQPAQPDCFVGTRIDADYVKAHDAVIVLRRRLQKDSGGAYQSCLLSRSDSVSGIREAVASAIPNFHENETLPVQHDQVNFAAAAIEVPLQATQSLSFKVKLRPRFGASP